MTGAEGTQEFGSELLSRVKVLGQIVAFTWSFWIVNALLFSKQLNELGICPRTRKGLIGIVFAPFLHADAEHLRGNTIAFLLLGALILIKGLPDFWAVTLMAALTSGVGTWLLGRDSTHLGASGIVFGYIGYLLIRGYLDHEVISTLITIAMLFHYSRKLWTLIIDAPSSISWEMHLFGFLGGVLAAIRLDDIKELLPALGIR